MSKYRRDGCQVIVTDETYPFNYCLPDEREAQDLTDRLNRQASAIFTLRNENSALRIAPNALSGRDPAKLDAVLTYADAVVESWEDDEIGQIDELVIDNLRTALAAFRTPPVAPAKEAR